MSMAVDPEQLVFKWILKSLLVGGCKGGGGGTIFVAYSPSG